MQQTLCRHIVTGIMDGRFGAGTRLPTEHELAAKFQTNRMNVHAAMKALEHRRILHRKRRVGTFVKADFDSRDVQALRNLIANQVAILLSTESEPHVHWNGNTLTEFERLLNQQDCQVTYREFPNDRESFEACLRELSGAGYRGVVLLPTAENNELLLRCMDLIESQPIEIYLLNRGDIPTDRCRCHMLCLDPYDEGVQVGRHIAERGWDAVTFLESGQSELVLWIQERKAGLQEGLRSASRGKLKATIRRVESDLNGFDFAQVAHPSSQAIPVIVTQNDTLAAVVLQRAAEQGRQASREFYLFSFDDNPMYRHYNLTTVSPPLFEMARDMVELLTGNGFATPRKQQFIIKLKSRIIERGTSGSRSSISGQTARGAKRRETA